MVEGSFHGFAAGRIVAAQLNRMPSIAYEVARLCSYGWPVLIRNSSFDEKGNFNPNLYYLSCPYLVKAISTLEDRGLIQELQQLMAKDRRLAADVSGAQSRHADEWLRQASIEKATDRDEVLAAIAREAPRIADSRDDSLLKCLHSHYAYYLAHDGYSLGYAIENRIGGRWCQDERCRDLMETGGK